MDYSQGYEQDFLIEYFNNKKNGLLVDIGAADGINNSNTRYLIENGWEGLLVEPNKKIIISYWNFMMTIKTLLLKIVGVQI